MIKDDRRRAERVEVAIPLDVSGDGENLRGETINISMNGVFFRFNRFIDPLTKVRMGLIIPAEEVEGGESRKAMFDGVVVRTDPEDEKAENGDYRIAVYITYMSKDSRAILSEFINRHI